jgi:hypothetical protein
LRKVEEAAMDGPISPPPVGGTAGNELPAYMSNGGVGLKVRDNPLSPGMALLSGFSGEHPERKIEAAALAPYPLAGDICLEGVWMSDTPQSVRIIDQAYDFDRRIDHPTEFQSGRSPSQNHRDVVLQPRSAHGGLPRNCY